MNAGTKTRCSHLNRQPARKRWLSAKAIQRTAIDFLTRQGWQFRTTAERSPAGKLYNALCVKDGKPIPVILQVRDGRPDILSELYSPFYAVNHPSNVLGRDMGDYGIKIVVVENRLVILDGEPHRHLLHTLVADGRWDILRVVTDAWNGRRKLLAFTTPQDYPPGAVQELLMDGSS